MADTSKLTDMLDNLINNKSDQAQVDFHGYLEQKMKEVITPRSFNVDDDSEKDM